MIRLTTKEIRGKGNVNRNKNKGVEWKGLKTEKILANTKIVEYKGTFIIINSLNYSNSLEYST